MTVKPADIRALSLTDVFKEIPDAAMEQFIMESSKIWAEVEDVQTRDRLIALHVADQMFRQLKAELNRPVEETPFSERLTALARTLPPPSFSLGY